MDRSYLEQTGIFSSLAELRRREAEREHHAGFAQTQVFQADGVIKVSLPDTPPRLKVKSALRERDADPERQLVQTKARISLLAVFSTFTLALRNLTRQKKRTAIGLSTVGFGVVAMLLASGFIEWSYENLRETTIRSRLGHVQVAQEGYFEKGQADPGAYLLPESRETIAQLEALPNVQLVTQRLSFSGLASHGETTVSFLGEGVEPAKEAEVSRHMKIVEGQGLSLDEPNGALLGAGLAENLGVGPGDVLVLLGSTPGGGFNAVEVRVQGLFRSITKAFDDTVLRTSIDLARQLTRQEGAHVWVVLADETRFSQAVEQELKRVLAGEGFDVVHWEDLAEFYRKVKELFANQVMVVRVIIAAIILISISNTLFMTVAERVGEIGTLMAVGFRRRRILELFVQEGFLVGLFGGLFGLVVGLALAALISAVGIPLPPPPGSTIGAVGQIHVTVEAAVLTLALAVVASVLASLYPSWKASRLVIVDALRKAR
ncbi:MAG: FtsX-like permease family protein [Gammaproteobacteria bacterium]|nr:FtsX-like permease family protein [Gammaproteobacteria bacterium]